MTSSPSGAGRDLIQIGQLLARYAIGMTKDDIDAVTAVFTTLAGSWPSPTSAGRKPS